MPSGREHIYGLDVLRILAMYYVCVLHVGGGFGGLKLAPDVFSQCGTLACIALAYVAVNIFMLTTGYVGLHHSWSWRGYARIWGEVAFYTLAGVLFSWWITGTCCSSETLRQLLFPIPFANGYWYFTAYTGAFFLFPYANRLLQNLSRREYGSLVLILLLSVGVFGIWNPSVGQGYNAVWLLIMYAVGGYIRLHLRPVRQRVAIGVYLFFSALSAILFAADIYVRKTYGWSCGLPSLGYTSPFIIVSSLSCFVFFVQLRIQNQLLRGFLRFVAPLSFAVYLIHEHQCIEPFFRRIAIMMGNVDHYYVWHTPLTAGLIFIICAAIDWCRRAMINVCFSLHQHVKKH